MLNNIADKGKFIFLFLVTMATSYRCSAETIGVSEVSTIVFIYLFIAAICSLVLGLLIKGILRTVDMRASNLVIFFISSVICLLGLFLFLK
jgi:hypothetical protein